MVVFLRSRFEIEFEKRKINNENVCSRRHFFDFLQEIAMSLFPVSLIVLFTPISIAFPELEIFLRSYLFNPSPGFTSFDLLFWIMCWNCFQCTSVFTRWSKTIVFRAPRYVSNSKILLLNDWGCNSDFKSLLVVIKAHIGLWCILIPRRLFQLTWKRITQQLICFFACRQNRQRNIISA